MKTDELQYYIRKQPNPQKSKSKILSRIQQQLNRKEGEDPSVAVCGVPEFPN